MLIYIVFFIFFALLSVEYELGTFKNNRILISIIIILLTLFAGLRGPNVTKDYTSYVIIFDYINDLGFRNDGVFLPLFEPGFVAVIILLKDLFTVNFVVAIMLFFALATILIKIISIFKISPFPYLVILFYFSHFFFLHEMTQIRIGFASSIFFIALIYYLKGQRITFSLLILVATFFHYSAILFLLLLLFDSKKFNKYIYAGVIVMSLALGYLRLPLLNFLGNFDPANLSGKLNNYTDLVESGSAESIHVFNTLTVLSIIICSYFILCLPKEKIIEDKPIALFLKCTILSVFLLCFLSGIPSIAFRFNELFALVSIFLYASLVKYLPFGKFNIVVTILIAGVIFYTIVFHTGLVNPYYLQTIK